MARITPEVMANLKKMAPGPEVKCPNCGKMEPANAKVCLDCGKPMPPPANAANQAKGPAT